MAYSGATAATSVANPPILMAKGMAGIQNSTALGVINLGTTALENTIEANKGPGNSWWHYTSTNATTDMTANNFFSDGWFLGMRPGDLVFGMQYTSGGSTGAGSISYMMGIVAASTAGASGSTNSYNTSTAN